MEWQVPCQPSGPLRQRWSTSGSRTTSFSVSANPLRVGGLVLVIGRLVRVVD